MTWLDTEIKRKYHKVADLFPLLDGSEFDELKADIAKNGLLEAIWLHPDGNIIDGRNRHRACIETETQPRFRTWAGQGSLVSFVVSLNLHRRHLTRDQRAGIGLKLIPAFAEEAKQQQGRRTDLSANLQKGFKPIHATEKAAEQVNVSTRFLYEAKAMQKERPDLADKLIAGEATIRSERKKKKAHVSQSTGNNEWYTPPQYIEAARQVMGGIDCDPASSEIANKTVCAETFYTVEDNGLEQLWHGRVWMNPPYSQPLIAKFAEALANKYASREIDEACVLVNNATDTKWFRSLFSEHTCMCLIWGRVRFIDKDGNPSGAPLQGQVILYFGPNDTKFAEIFSQFGGICHAW